MDRKAAVEEAVDWAIRENLLNGFFKKQRAEVIVMSLTEFDEEEFKRICRADGYEDGVNDKAIEAAENFLKADVDPETISRCIGLPLDQILQIKEKLSVKA